MKQATSAKGQNETLALVLVSAASTSKPDIAVAAPDGRSLFGWGWVP